MPTNKSKVLRWKPTPARVRFQDWLDFANLPLPPESGMSTPDEMAEDDPVVVALHQRFLNKFEPRRAFKPYTEDEKAELRERIRTAKEPLFPGPRNQRKLQLAVEETLAEVLRQGSGEFLSFFTWHGDGRGTPQHGPFGPNPAAIYNLYYRVRRALQAIVEAAREREADPSGLPGYAWIPMPPFRILMVGSDGLLRAATPGDFNAPFGRIDPFHDRFVPLLLGRTIDVRLLRTCEVCRVFFYAKRRDQLACNSAHRDVIRARRFREKNPHYDENRLRNAAAKEKRKSGKWIDELMKADKRKTR